MNVNDVGAALFVNIHENGVNKNLTDVDSIIYCFQKPDGEKLCVAGTIVSGLDGRVVYFTKEGDIDQEGIWLLQVRVIKTNVYDISTIVTDFSVGPDL